MKLKYAILSFLLCLCAGAFSQSEVETPNYDEIKMSTFDKNSPLYYPKLMNRFMECDTTLTLEDYRSLYYGFVFQEDYNPYRVSPYSLKVKEYATQDATNSIDCDSIISYGLKAMDDFPFDIRTMNMLVYAYQCTNNETEKLKWSYKLKGIIDAIISSGDGEEEASAFHVIYAPHEYELLLRFGLSAKSTQIMDTNFDYIEVESNKFNVKGYFFNILKLREVFHSKFNETVIQ
ncbi:MAG: DUF4919 domain-containing protein [Bacteroidales bacterium]|nr:DUF4919 domain-containing protein [Bacteroidales bacterium]